MPEPKTIQKHTGVLSKIEIATVQKGQNEGKKFRKITVGGTHFTVFDGKWFPVLEELDSKVVDVEYTTRPNPDPDKRDFWDFEGITLGVAQEPSRSNGGNGYWKPKSPEDREFDERKERSFRAQKALELAIQTQAQNQGEEQPGIFAFADKYFEWIETKVWQGQKPAQPQSPDLRAIGDQEKPPAGEQANGKAPAKAGDQMDWNEFYAKAGELGFKGVGAVCKALGIKKIDDWAETKELALEQLGQVAAGNAQRVELPF